MAADTTLDGLIRDAFSHLMTDVRVSLPGKIESFNADRTATVQPMISRKFKGAAAGTKLPVIQNVPVVEPRTQKAIAHLPITKGDPVLLVFSDRAVGNLLGSSGAIPSLPLDVRQHDISDAVASLGGWPTLQEGVTPGASAAAGITVAEGTKIYLGNGSVELLDVLDQIITVFEDVATGVMTALTAHVHVGGVGVPVVPFTPFQLQLTIIKELLAELKT